MHHESAGIRAAFALYNIAWTLAQPLAGRNKRLKQGWNRRTLSGGESFPAADVWMHAASVGEAFLAREVALRLDTSAPLRLLITTNTSQGMEILQQFKDRHDSSGGLVLHISYAPLDRPALVRKALRQVSPRVYVVLETEIWPGILRECKRQGVKTLLINGRMRSSSLADYLSWPGLFQSIAPDRVLAISEEDALRFSLLFRLERAEVMPNIKFDRIAPPDVPLVKDNPLAELLPTRKPFVVFGSVREEEEPEVLEVLRALFEGCPEAVVGLFPRHESRHASWDRQLSEAAIPHARRSALSGRALPGSVILWDTFGELVQAYGLAKAAFVGGSLAPLGGQNFLEPLACGVIPVIGPHWDNFAWIGGDIFRQELVRVEPDWQGVATALLEQIADAPNRNSVRAQTEHFLDKRRGGAETAAAAIAHFLKNE